MLDPLPHLSCGDLTMEAVIFQDLGGDELNAGELLPPVFERLLPRVVVEPFPFSTSLHLLCVTGCE